MLLLRWTTHQRRPVANLRDALFRRARLLRLPSEASVEQHITLRLISLFGKYRDTTGVLEESIRRY